MQKTYFNKDIPSSSLDFRSNLFGGELYLTPASQISLSFATKVNALIKDVLNVQDIRQAHEELDADSFFQGIGKLRRIIYLDKEYHTQCFDILESYGFERPKVVIDPFRLRVVTPNGHKNKAAAPVYYPHRDTWYSHPQSLIVLWLPLHDLRMEETFIFYPDYFRRAVPNNSEVFNYDDWIKDGPELKIGWQDKESGIKASYPRSDENFEVGNGIGFSTKAGQHLFFSGAHYHKTRQQNTHQTRYSLDVRFIHLDDVTSGLSATNADNRSRGSALKDYIKAS